MIVLVATLKGKPGTGDAIAEAMTALTPLVHANEPGCSMYQVCRSTENRDHFLVYEHYVDQAALDAHRAAPHFQQYLVGVVLPLVDEIGRGYYDLVAG